MSSAYFGALNHYAAALGVRVIRAVPEEQGSDYEAGLAHLDDGLWRVRTARVTPTKPGAFVAVWSRDEAGETAPIQVQDGVDGLLVFVANTPDRGVFRFPWPALAELGIAPSDRFPGKRGFRVYPPWCGELNKQATRTQRAQAAYFEAY